MGLEQASSEEPLVDISHVQAGPSTCMKIARFQVQMTDAYHVFDLVDRNIRHSRHVHIRAATDKKLPDFPVLGLLYVICIRLGGRDYLIADLSTAAVANRSVSIR